MKTGIELIAQERAEQISKHGYSIDHDHELYNENQLRQAAIFCLTGRKKDYPKGWSDHFRDNIKRKQSRLSALEFRAEMNKIAASFLAADIDVIIKKIAIETTIESAYFY